MNQPALLINMESMHTAQAILVQRSFVFCEVLCWRIVAWLASSEDLSPSGKGSYAISLADMMSCGDAEF